MSNEEHKIDEFRGFYRFLSNFHAAKVVLDGVTYPSVENAYQAAKTSSPSGREFFTTCSAGDAKRMGRTIPLRSGWEDMKIDVMRDLIRQKFSYRSSLADSLLATESSLIIEGNTWGDVFWGVCNGRGENHLGRLLMERRTSLRRITQISYWRGGLSDSASALERRAALFAALAHDGQRRKGSDAKDYIVHPYAVAEILREVLDPNDIRSHHILAAAWLHDVVEDTDVTLDEVRREFGDEVADIVGMVTNPSRPEDGNRAARKAIDRNHLMQADSRGKLLKLADVIQNLSSVLEISHEFAAVYVLEKEALLRLFGDDSNLPLLDRAWDALESMSDEVGCTVRRPCDGGLGVSALIAPCDMLAYQTEDGPVSAALGLQP